MHLDLQFHHMLKALAHGRNIFGLNNFLLYKKLSIVRTFDLFPMVTMMTLAIIAVTTLKNIMYYNLKGGGRDMGTLPKSQGVSRGKSDGSFSILELMKGRAVLTKLTEPF